jgi:preprotein translocase subunit SecA
MRRIEKQILLQTIDQNWRDHLQNLDALRSAVGLRGYAQRDPLNEFKTEAFELFEHLLDQLRYETTRVLFHLRMAQSSPAPEAPQPPKNIQAQHIDPQTGRNEMDDSDARPAQSTPSPTATRVAAQSVDPKDPGTWGRVPRNAACPCGSGKKYKHCHGAIGQA